MPNPDGSNPLISKPKGAPVLMFKEWILNNNLQFKQIAIELQKISGENANWNMKVSSSFTGFSEIMQNEEILCWNIVFGTIV